MILLDLDDRLESGAYNARLALPVAEVEYTLEISKGLKCLKLVSVKRRFEFVFRLDCARSISCGEEAEGIGIFKKHLAWDKLGRIEQESFDYGGSTTNVWRPGAFYFTLIDHITGKRGCS